VNSLRTGVASAALCFLLGTSGCALTSKADPIEVTYLRPNTVPAGVPGAGAPLRLERVEAGEALGRDLLVVEEGTLKRDEHYQWTEVPAVFLERTLSRTLFEVAPGKTPCFRRDLAPGSPRLAIELLRYEWILGGAFRLECRAVLWRKDRALWERTFSSESKAGEPKGLERAAGEALSDVANQLRAALGG